VYFLNFKKEGKKGQISIFFVIGLVLIIVFGIVFFYRTRANVFNPEKITEIQSTPITSYVDVCVRIEGMNLLTKLGRQGGYVEFPEKIKFDPRSYISELPGSKLSQIPFWYYQNDLRIPSLSEMEDDLSEHMTNNVYTCVNDFRTFEELYIINILENISVKARITAKTVQFDTLYPVDIVKKSDNQKIELRDYKTTLNVRLTEAHEMAEKFVRQSLENGYLETLTMHLILLDPEIPVDGLDFGLGQKELGFIPEIQSSLYSLLREVLVTRVRFSFRGGLISFTEEKSEYERLLSLSSAEALAGMNKNVPEDFYDYKHFFFEIFDYEDYDGLNSNVNLGPEDYFKLNTNPNKNGWLYSTSKKISETIKLPSLGLIRFWHFLYDVYYPVIFSVRDSNAFNNRGFTFKVAHPVHLKKNRPAQRDAVAYNNFEFTSTSSICDVENSQRTITVNTQDGYDFNPFTGYYYGANDVEIYYQCPTEICYFGNTSYITEQTSGIELQLPDDCINGLLVAKKDGYITTQKQAITSQDNFNIVMRPTKEFNFDVKAFSDFACSDDDIQYCEYNLERYPQNYSIVIQVESKDTDYISYGIFNSTDPSKNKINLTMGENKLDIYLILDDEIITGGYHANLTVSYSKPDDFWDFYDFDAQDILFKIYAKAPSPRDDDEIIELHKFFEDNKLNHIEKLKPEFS